MTTVDRPALTPGAQRILDAASRLFYERGIHAVGVDAVSAAAGVTKKTLYDRFGSKEALVLAYLRSRDARWRAHLDAHLADVAEDGPARALAVFDAARSWAAGNSSKGCSAINARAELGLGGEGDGEEILREVQRQKAWQLTRFTDLCSEGGVRDPAATAATLMLLYEGALVTLGMATFDDPFAVARTTAERLLAAA